MSRIEDGVAFPIRAEDQFSSNLNALIGKTKEAGSAFERFSSIVGGVAGKLTAIFAFAGIASGIKSVIDYADKLADLNKITGVSVETLDGLSYAAKTAGVDLDALAKGVGKLQKNLFDTVAGDKDLGAIFKKMGIDASSGLKDTEETLFKLADRFVAIRDPGERAALAMKLFGKEGAALIPLLLEGGDRLREMTAEQKKYGGITDETANRADTFNDTLAKLKLMGSALYRELASALLPTLQAVADIFVQAKEKGSDFRVIAEGATVIFKGLAAAGLTVYTALKSVGDAIGGLVAANVAFYSGNFKEGLGYLKAIKNNAIETWTQYTTDVDKILTATGGKVAAKGKGTGEGYGKALNDALKKELERLEKLALESWKAFAEAAEKSQESLDDAFRTGYLTMKSTVKELQFQASLIGLSADEQERLNTFRKLDQEFIKAIVGQDEKRIRQLTEQLDLAKQQIDAAIKLKGEKQDQLRLEELDRKARMDALAAEVRQNEQIANSLGDALMRGFESGKGFAENFIETLKNMFKTLVLRPIIQPIAQSGANWVQSVIGGGQGGGMNLSSLLSIGGNLAGGLGSAASGLGSFFGSSTLSAFGAGMQGSTLAAGLAGPTTAGATGAMGLGSQVGSFLSAAGPWVAAALAIYALHKTFGDKGENWKGRLGFGSQANAYATQGLFGSEGFAYLAGNDATNRSIQAFMASTGGIDKQLMGSLSGQQIEAIKAQLSGYSRRTDGQPAEFAFSKDDQTASAQLTLEYLKVKYGAVFDQLDKTFADYIRSYTGKSEDLVKELSAFSAVLEQLQGTGVKGLNLNSLRALQQDGEELSSTFQRVAQGMSSINSMFVDETDAYLQALKLVGDEFSAMGVDLPVTADTFKTLRDGLDLSTEAGRDMFNMLVRVAPAMQQIDQATRSMMSGFNAAMGQIFGSGFTRQLLEIQATGLLSRFQSLTGIGAGIDPLALFKSIGGQNPADLQYIMSTFGPEVQTLLTQILQLYSQYIGLQDKVNENTGSLGGTLGTVVDQLSDAKKGLRAYLDSLFLNESLSPLTPMQRFSDAKSQWESTLKLAQGGDLGAIGNLQGITDIYLNLARQIFGSSGAYNDIFRTVTGGIGGVAGVSQGELNTRLAGVLPIRSQLASQDDIRQLALILADISDGVNGKMTTEDVDLRKEVERMRIEMQALRQAIA